MLNVVKTKLINLLNKMLGYTNDADELFRDVTNYNASTCKKFSLEEGKRREIERKISSYQTERKLDILANERRKRGDFF